MRTRLISLILLIPASWLLYSTIALLFLFMLLNIQGWAGCLVYLPLVLLAVYLLILPKILLLDGVKTLLDRARKYTRSQDLDSANHCYEQAMALQKRGKQLGLSMVLTEYSHFMKRIDESEASELTRWANKIQKDALRGKFVEEFDEDDSY